MRLVRCCSVNSNEGRPSSVESEVHCSKQRESAIELSVLSVAKTAWGDDSEGDNMASSGGITEPALRGDIYAGPPIILGFHNQQNGY